MFNVCDPLTVSLPIRFLGAIRTVRSPLGGQQPDLAFLDVGECFVANQVQAIPKLEPHDSELRLVHKADLEALGS